MIAQPTEREFWPHIIYSGDGWWTLSLTCHANRTGLACVAPRFWPLRAWLICECNCGGRQGL